MESAEVKVVDVTEVGSNVLDVVLAGETIGALRSVDARRLAFEEAQKRLNDPGEDVFRFGIEMDKTGGFRKRFRFTGVY